MRLYTGITADQPTKLGSVYPHEALEKLVSTYNARLNEAKNSGHPITGGWLTDKMSVGEEKPRAFFEVNQILLSEGKLFVDIEYLKTDGLAEEKQKFIKETIHIINEQKNSNLIAKLIIELPLDQAPGQVLEHIRRVYAVALTWSQEGPKLIRD